jgi:hypothetical protein
MKLHRVFLQDNAVLQKMILAQLDDLGEEIELLESGLSSESGPLCLAIDEEGRFVLLIPTVQEDDAILVKALGQMSWLNRHQSLLARLFSKRGVESSQSPRVVLIAPGFSSVFQEAVAMTGLDIELYQYRALEFERQQTLLLDPVGVPRRRAGQPAASVSVIPLDPSSRIALTDAERNFFEGASPKSLST